MSVDNPPPPADVVSAPAEMPIDEAERIYAAWRSGEAITDTHRVGLAIKRVFPRHLLEQLLVELREIRAALN